MEPIQAQPPGQLHRVSALQGVALHLREVNDQALDLMRRSGLDADIGVRSTHNNLAHAVAAVPHNWPPAVDTAPPNAATAAAA